MFTKARIKLTIWYSFIIMLISIVFSMAIYALTAREVERGFRRVHMFMQPPPRQQALINLNPELEQDLNQVKENLILNLVLINGFILLLSAGSGYFLAGQTLRPIQKALEDQKRFVADASHELKTPLTSLKTSIEVALRDKKLTKSRAREVLAENLEDIDSLDKLTAVLLDLTNYQDNGSSLVFEEKKLSPILQKAAARIKLLADKKGVEVKTSLTKPDLKARINLQTFTQMLLIFLDNAVKYTPKGGKVTVTLESKKDVLIMVKDNGIGIAKKHLPFIFDRFYRVDQSRSKQNVPGFGLGLSLAQKIIKLHSGSIEVKSRPGKGTSFIIKLPKN